VTTLPCIVLTHMAALAGCDRRAPALCIGVPAACLEVECKPVVRLPRWRREHIQALLDQVGH